MKRIPHFIILLIAVSSVFAARIDRVVFHGNRGFSSSELNELLNLSSEREYSETELSQKFEALSDSLMKRDYIFARVDSFHIETRKSNILLRVFLHEGPLAEIHTIRWLGEKDALPDRVFHRMLSKDGSRFSWSNLRFDIQSLLDYFDNNGYPFAKIEILKVEQESLNEQSVNIDLKILSGPFVQIRFLKFNGNRVTHSGFLKRETRLSKDEVYSRQKINSARRYLRRLPFIRIANEPRLSVNDDGQIGLIFDLEESRMSRVDMVAGYSPGAENESGTFSGLVDLELMNFFGEGRKARVHWERPNQDIQSIDLAYIEPWVANQPVSLQADFKQRIQDTLYVTRQFGLKATLSLSAYVSVWGSARREAVIVDSTDAIALSIEGSSTNYLEMGVEYDSRDHPLNPRNGILFSTFGGQGWRKLIDPEPVSGKKIFTHHRVGLDSEVDFELIPFWILSLSTHARSLVSDEPVIKLPDLYRLGGARTLRGYREEQFVGSRVGWASLEVRYWLGTASRVFLFSDAGAIYREILEQERLSSTSIFKTSTGLGLRLETGMGVWGIDYGIGENDNLLRGKLHISLFSTF
jgi:outer membrane protein insertion porin family